MYKCKILSDQKVLWYFHFMLFFFPASLNPPAIFLSMKELKTKMLLLLLKLISVISLLIHGQPKYNLRLQTAHLGILTRSLVSRPSAWISFLLCSLRAV